MASPSFSGEMWVERASLDFSSANLGSLRLTAVPHEMPGKTTIPPVGRFARLRA